MNWRKLVQENGVPEWPYPIEYGEEETVSTDVLVLGGGIAGCWAAISAARSGVRVLLVEKGATIRSGAGGTGCDHWLNTPNPLSSISAEEIVKWEIESAGGYANGLSRYIAARESYETLLEMEKMGGKIRDTGDEFKGSRFRDDETKFLFAYDYENRIHFRIWGTTFKPALFHECKRLGVHVYDRVMATGLLTEKGEQGTRVIGATGLHCRTGKFFVFHSKAVINCLSRHQRNWTFSTELRGISCFRPPQIAGDGHAMAWRAGAEFTMLEKSAPHPINSGHSLLMYSSGNPFNTWVPCTMVYAKGKEVPWVDRDGRIVQVEERTKPAPGQRFMGERATNYANKRPALLPNLEERIRKGEFELPLYADLPAMPDYERKAIWGLMVGEEGRSRIPILETYGKAGFDPQRDLLQSYLFLGSDPVKGTPHLLERNGGESGDAGGLMVDWDLRTNLEGLYCAGDAIFAANFHYHAAVTGRYAGRKAAQYVRLCPPAPALFREQVDVEKRRVYAPLEVDGDIDWKEINAAACRKMQNYCGEYKNEKLLRIGLMSLQELERDAIHLGAADNPHKLVRLLEVLDILTCSQMIIHQCMARKASCSDLYFIRTDSHETDPREYHKWITIKQFQGELMVGDKPIDFWGPLEENYQRHR